MVKAEVIKKDEKEVFKPVTIQLTFDNQMELDYFRSVFDYVPIFNLADVGEGWCGKIMDATKQAGAKYNYTHAVAVAVEKHINRLK
jgi:hypothetical protein